MTFAELAAIAIGVAALALASAAFVRTGRTAYGERRSDDSAVRIATGDPVPAEGTAAATGDNEARPEPPSEADEARDPAPETPPPTLDAVAAAVAPLYDAVGHPREMERYREFQTGVRLLADPRCSLDDVVMHCTGANAPLAVVAAAALEQRHDSSAAVEPVLAHVPFMNAWLACYALRFIDAKANEPVVCRVLLTAPEWWTQNPIMPRLLSDFVDARLAHGEQPVLSGALDRAAAVPPAHFRALLGRLSTPVARTFEAELDAWLASRVDREYLRSVGRVVDGTREGRAPGAHARLEDAAASIVAGVVDKPHRSFTVVGEVGVGKSTVLRVVAARLTARGWTVFEASAADVLAGMAYIGELEGRIKRLVDELDVQRRVAWIVPAFAELGQAGRHRYSSTSALDYLMPALEAGRLVLLGEEEPDAFERLVLSRPRLRTLVRRIHIPPMSAVEALQLGEWMATDELARAGVDVAPGTVREAVELAGQYLAARALPGAMVELLRGTVRRLAASPVAGGARFDREALLATLREITGLPATVLDDREALDLDALRRHFDARVLGQPEAVECLVDRVAMLKAGLADPRRPIGVFLFAGPTGTGKTEVAKTLAAFLFGSAERMIRVDMSELQDAQSLGRIVGEVGGDGDSLASCIRRQPFSLVLLDEFEKAHPRVWDLFLQVFDDGRLTDARGATADFRHAIVILTTNLGATAHGAARLGFTQGGSAFGEAQVLRAIGEAFRPEFVNRIDRVVVFRPLDRAVMRDILRKELHEVLGRRGLRSREWAVEWEESAIEFLLDQGFTPDMGARPLRRAIERYVLAPLARTIVEHRFPEGDQFLFVRRRGDALEVEFVDPDVPGEARVAAEIAHDETAPASLGRLVLAPPLDAAGRARLEAALVALEDRVAAPVWLDRKAALLQEINRSEFWNDPRHREVLDSFERMDRVEAGVRAARSLARRVEPRRGLPGASPATVVASLAEQIYLLDAAMADLNANVPGDVWMSVERVGDDASAAAGDLWAARLSAMYLAWAKKRRMRATALEDGASRHVLSIGGFGVHRILVPEAGLHVLEAGECGDADGRRCTARVRVVPEPSAAPRSPERSLAAALVALADPACARTSVVRRYREGAAPLVRDAVAGWRTGRIDLVLQGDFDLLR